MIIDEAFDSADNNNKQEMKKLISYLRSQYDWLIIVSHDEDIKDAFDTDNLNHIFSISVRYFIDYNSIKNSRFVKSFTKPKERIHF